MSPAAQYTAVIAVTLGALGLLIPAVAALVLTGVLLLWGFRVPAAGGVPDSDSSEAPDPPPQGGPTPNEEAERTDG